MNIEEFVNIYLEKYRHDILLNPYDGLIGFAKSLLAVVATDKVIIPSCWFEPVIKKSPSTISWASVDGDGQLESGITYYDADGNEITKEEYEALLGQTTD